MIKADDIITTLQHLNLIQYQKGQHVICAAPHVIDAHLKAAGSPGLQASAGGGSCSAGSGSMPAGMAACGWAAAHARTQLWSVGCTAARALAGGWPAVTHHVPPLPPFLRQVDPTKIIWFPYNAEREYQVKY